MNTQNKNRSKQITEALHTLYKKAGPELLKIFQEANGREVPGIIEYGIVGEDAYDAENGILIVLSRKLCKQDTMADNSGTGA